MNWLQRNGWRLLMSLILSFFLWLFVTITTNPLVSTTFDGIPVMVRGLSAGLVIVGQDGLPRQDQMRLGEASLQVETDRSTLATLRASDFQVSADLTGRGEGVHVLPLESSTTARNARVIAVEPAEVSLRLEEIITSTVPITIEVIGNLPFSFERDEPEVRFDDQVITQAMLTGPRNLVQLVERASATVNIEQIRATYTSVLALEPRNSNGDPVTGVTIAPEQVGVEIRVRSVVGLKRVPVLANVIGIPAPGHIVTRVESTPALIDLVGSSSLLNAIERIDTAPVDIAGATGTLTATVPLRLRGAQPSDLGQTSAVVVVEVRAFDQPFQAQLLVAIEVVGVAPGLLLTYTPQSVLGTFSAPTAEFLQFQSRALTATVDVSGLGAGFYNLVPQLILPDTVQLVNPLPTVQVTLRAPDTPTPLPTPVPLPTATPQPTDALPPTATATDLPEPATLVPATVPPSVDEEEEPTLPLPPTPTTPQGDATDLPLPTDTTLPELTPTLQPTATSELLPTDLLTPTLP